MSIICYIIICYNSYDNYKSYMNGWKFVTVNHHLAMFGGVWSSAHGDIKYLIFHVIPQNQVIEGSSNFMRGSFLCYVTTLPSLVAIGMILVEIKCF